MTAKLLVPVALAATLSASASWAQPRPAQPPGARPAARAPDPEPREAPIRDPLTDALAPKPGGLTPTEVGRAAERTRHPVRQKQADLRAASARVDQALVSYFPRVTLTATYARLSPVDPISLGAGAVLAAQNPGPVTTGPCPLGTCIFDSAGAPVGAVPLSLSAPPVNQYSLVASVIVPVSDYALRIRQNHGAASHNEAAKRYEAEAQALQDASDAKIAFYNWVRAKGQVVVAHEAVEQVQAHVVDARRNFDAGLLSRADVLRLEAQVASAQQVEAESIAFASVAEEQLRTVMGVRADQRLEIGIDVMHEPPAAPTESLEALQQEAYKRRRELRAFDESIGALKQAESVSHAGYVPRIDGFADGTYANPNSRFFPPEDRWDFTWDIGVRATWVINDTFTALGASAEARARTASVTEQKGTVRDGIRLEVASAYADLKKSVPTIEASDRGVVAAAESLRVRRDLFRNGRGTAVDLIDAETELTRARLGQLQARVGLLAAKTRLNHATGRDAPATR
jgi:outer membrane protein TolC